MHIRKDDFPIFRHHPELIYLDSAASAQKPAAVIEWITTYLEHDYANIHRGLYGLAQRSEDMYWATKRLVADWLWASQEEIIFTSNSTAASNLLAQSLMVSGLLKAWDKIVVSTVEHHANIVPRQMAAQQCWCELVYVWLDDWRDISLVDLERVWDDSVKVVALSYVSNVTGKIHRVKEIGDWLAAKRKQWKGKQWWEHDVGVPLYIVDASQAAPHLHIDVQTLWCDALYLTWHKLGAWTGIGVLWWKAEFLRRLTPSLGGWSAIVSVSEQTHVLQDIPDKFEPGTPNLIGVVSLMKALEYLKGLSAVGGRSQAYDAIHIYEKPLIAQCLKWLLELEDSWKIKLIGPRSVEDRIGVFSFTVGGDKNPFQLGQFLADHHVCVRVGGQCAQPFHDAYTTGPTCRVSLWLYTTSEDIEVFLKLLCEYLNNTST